MPNPYRKSEKLTKKGLAVYVGYMCRACNTARSRKYRATQVGKERNRIATKRSIARNTHKQNAREKVREAVRTGGITKPDYCANCRKPKVIEAHHEDYSRPLEVLWVCRQCHADIHRK